jgi:CheY-like chemotaxis protein
MRIIVVEDNQTVSEDISGLLTDQGHCIVGVADNGPLAMRMGSKGADLALIDLRLRDGMTGGRIARHLFELYGTPSMFVSANVQHCRDEAKTSRVLGCLAKPFTDTDLLKTVAIAEAISAGHVPPNPPARLELYSHGG